MNFANLEQSEITLYGQGNNDVMMKFPVPPELQYNLATKRVGIQDMEIDTRSFPRFIPQLLWYDTNVNSYTGGSTVQNRIGDSDFYDVLGYFFVIRKNDNSISCTSFVQWSNPNNFTTFPTLNGPDPRTIYLTPYYYCYNFMDFLDMCQQAIVAGLTNVFIII